MTLKDFSLKDVITGVLIFILTGALTFFSVQLNKITDMENTIQNLPFTTDAELLKETVKEIQETGSNNDTRLSMLLFKLKEEGILDESDINLINNN